MKSLQISVEAQFIQRGYQKVTMVARIEFVSTLHHIWALTEKQGGWRRTSSGNSEIQRLQQYVSYPVEAVGVDDTNTLLPCHAGGHERRDRPDPANASGEGCISS